MENQTELQKKNILRQSSKEANVLTKECIELALIHLMKEKPFSEIKITDIIHRSGVSRVSYYRNYDSKEAILENHLHKIINSVNIELLKFDPTTEGKEAWLKLLQLTRELSDDYTLLLDADFGDTLLRQFIKIMNNNNPDNLDSITVNNWYLSGCMFSVITEWIKEGMKTPEETIAEICNSLMFNGVKDIVKCVVEE